jgi:indolepyruvate ferredoxin oxidoreductase beta subunit
MRGCLLQGLYPVGAPVLRNGAKMMDDINVANTEVELRLIIAGLGGQGVVFLTRLLSQTAVSLDYPVMVSETHGMSQRGGSVISHLKVGGNKAALIGRGTADALLALETDEAVRNLPYLRTACMPQGPFRGKGGVVFVNSEGRNTSHGLRMEVAEHLDRLNIEVLSLPASRLAQELGTPAVTNVILAGFAAAHPILPLPFDALGDTVKRIAPRALELNVQALEIGFRAGQAALNGVKVE